MVERGTLEIFRFVPPPLLEGFDLQHMDDFDDFLTWLARARVVQEIEKDIVLRAISEAFVED